MRTYEQVRKQWETLWAIAPAHDMTGGYEDQNDLARLLKNPTKKTAKECMEDQICHWFDAGPDEHTERRTVREIIEADPDVRLIAEDYGYA